MAEGRSISHILKYRFHFLIFIFIFILQVIAGALYLTVNDIATVENIRIFAICYVCELAFYIIVSAVKGMDMYCIIPALFLYGFGMPIVHYIDPTDLKMNLYGFLIGIVGFFFAAFFVCSDELRILKMKRLLYILGFLLVASAAVLGSTDQYGGHSWIHIGPLSMQPSEFFKPLLVVLLAVSLSKQYPIRKHFLFILYLVMCLGIIVMGLNDTGMAVILMFTILVVFTLGGIKKRYLLVFIGALAVFIPVLFKLKPHIWERFKVILDGPFSDYQGSGYHVSRGLMLMINGGFFGSGASQNMKELFAASSDFAFVSVCSYYGWLFAIAVLVAFALLILRSFLTSIRVQSRYHSLLAAGAGSMLVMQGIWHITGLLGLFPLSGITLPFVSAGGTSMITSFVLLGLIQGASVADARLIITEAKKNAADAKKQRGRAGDAAI